MKRLRCAILDFSTKSLRSIFQLICIAGIFAMTSCATARLEVPVTRPAEINTSKFKRVFVGDFKNSTSLPNPSGKMEFALTNALSATGKFEVIEKEAYENFIKGKQTNNDDVLIINGIISGYKGAEEVRQGQPYKDKEGKTYVDYTRVAAMSYGVQFKVSKASSGTVIGAREVVKEVSDTRSATNAKPSSIDLEALFRTAESQVVEEFLKKIVPYQEMVQVELYSDKEIPELEQGIASAKKGEWEQSIMLFKTATEKYSNLKPEQQATALYDLGMAEVFSYRFADAKKHLNKAASLDSKTTQYIKALNDCNIREMEYKKVQEQSGQ